MPPRPLTGKPVGRPAGPKRAVLTVRIRPDRAKALRRLARERAKATGGQLDVSAVLRELLDRALATPSWFAGSPSGMGLDKCGLMRGSSRPGQGSPV